MKIKKKIQRYAEYIAKADRRPLRKLTFIESIG